LLMHEENDQTGSSW